MASLFHTSIKMLSGIGEKKAEQYKRLGVESVGDLLRFYPRTYEDWSSTVQICEAAGGETCCVHATVAKTVPPAKLRGGVTVFRVVVCDNYDYMTVTFFNREYVYRMLCSGGDFLFYGTVRGCSPRYEMTSPAVAPAETGQRIHPIYRQTDKLTTKMIENAVQQALSMLPNRINDPIPENIREKFSVCGLGYAISNIHFPTDAKALKTARNRLAFEELLVLQLGMAMIKSVKSGEKSHRIDTDATKEFFSLLPFTPTKAQRRAVSECVMDMKEGNRHMTRLIQGDVGSGKTAVAAAVCHTAVKNGLQCAFMAPTEILAMQHFRSLSALFKNTDINLVLLTGSTKKSEKEKIYEGLESGSINIVVGTHALLTEKVRFGRLGLVVTDEQHRFGVSQRAALMSKGTAPHLVVMSATPIPRTLALMIFGDLDLSVLDELPPGRQVTATYRIGSKKRQKAFGFISERVACGEQAYIVCPLVEKSENLDLQSAREYRELIEKSPLGNCRTSVLYGSMKPSEKEDVMRRFAQGEIDVLVSTTVIEVGVDVPNATVILIENAERFGLSQLHQLRGRVGRGGNKSYCFLLSDAKGETACERLNVLCRTNDGFKVADEDLRLRGPGDFFGSRQHGLPELRSAELSDMQTVELTKQAALEILSKDRTLSIKEYRPLAFEVGRLFKKVGGQNGIN